jgi:hypothetical protein
MCPLFGLLSEAKERFDRKYELKVLGHPSFSGLHFFAHPAALRKYISNRKIMCKA